MKLQQVNKTGILLRLLGVLFLAGGLPILLLPISALLSGSSLLSLAKEEDLIFVTVFAIVLVAFSILLFRKTQRTLKIAQMTNVLGAAFFLTALVYIGRDSDGLGHPGILAFYLPLYIPVITLIHLFITVELNKMRKAKFRIRDIFIPALAIIGLYTLAMILFV